MLHVTADTMSSRTNLMSSSAAGVDNLAERVDKCLAIRGRYYCLCTIRSVKNVHYNIYMGYRGCLLFRGCLDIEVNGRTVEIFI